MNASLPPYRIVRSDRKTLALEITRNAEVLVRAPRRTSSDTVKRFVEAHADWIATHLQKRIAYLEAATFRPSEEQISALREAARKILADKLTAFSVRMGVQPTHLSITSAEHRFGSCSSTGRICFSWRLLLYPEEAVDYVVVHELAHLLHHDHSPAFYACVARYLPDHRKRAALLRQPPQEIPAWVREQIP
jgi:predicted metal-dependent hydrolase